jgi:predicted type IV restriction endonuclease
MLCDLLGYDKYVEVTTEFAIRGTFVDLAVKVGQDTRFLIEAKAIGVELKDIHVKQAIDYGANQGIEWVILTNGIVWRVYKINFTQPIDKSLVFEIDLLEIGTRDAQAIEWLGTLSREGFTQSSMTALLQQRQATSKFSVAAVLMSESIITALRRELRRHYPNVRIDDEVLSFVIENEVLKREVVDSDEAQRAQQVIKKAIRKETRAKEKTENEKEASSSNPIPTQSTTTSQT